MKFLKKTTLLAVMALLAIFMQSCKKDSQVLSNSKPYNFNVYVENGNPLVKVTTNSYLYFPTADDYDSCLAYLVNCDEGGLDEFESNLQFISMRSSIKGLAATSKDIEEMNDDVLGTFLNPEGFVRIGDSLYQIDVEESTVIFLSLAENSDGLFRKYTEAPDDEQSKCSCDDGTSLGMTHQHYIFNEGSSHELNAFISYRNLLVYHSLVAVIKDNFDSAPKAKKSMYVYPGWYFLQGKPERKNFSEYDSGIQNDRKIHKTVACSGFRRMRDYDLKVDFYLENSVGYYEDCLITLSIPR